MRRTNVAQLLLQSLVELPRAISGYAALLRMLMDWLIGTRNAGHLNLMHWTG